jgi:LmbE family N-acetylglucosaminyl deacetylase
MLRLMAITAHPDDEAANFGGALRIYADRGVETCVLCLTPGQAATHRGGAKNDQELAAMRRRELAAACEILKVNCCTVLEFPDGQLYRQDLYRVVHDVTLQVREFRPQVILAFGPEGGVTAHVDHSMSSLFATLAFHWAGRENRFPDQLRDGRTAYRPQKLYYSSADFALPDRPPIALPPITAVIDIGPHRQTKITAFQAHTSQAPLWPYVEKRLQERKQFEKFHLAASVHPGPVEMENDLFGGVRED